MSSLGGRRPRQNDANRNTNAKWRVQSFHNYADYALGKEFGAAFDRLVKEGEQRRVAIMRAEAVLRLWRCYLAIRRVGIASDAALPSCAAILVTYLKLLRESQRKLNLAYTADWPMHLLPVGLALQAFIKIHQ